MTAGVVAVGYGFRDSTLRYTKDVRVLLLGLQCQAMQVSYVQNCCMCPGYLYGTQQTGSNNANSRSGRTHHVIFNSCTGWQLQAA
eukprot:111411-Pleurochrysis_carterae.AAC.1